MDSDDPTADFLAREQAILGAEAALFGNPIAETSSFEPVQAAIEPNQSAIEQPQEFDFFQPVKPAEPLPVQQNIFGTVEPNQNIFGTVPPADPTQNMFGTAVPAFEAPVEPIFQEQPQPVKESQALKEWKEQFELKVQERDTTEREKHSQILKEAKEQLDKFYAEYNEKKKKLTQKQPEPKTGNVWERVYKNIEKEKSDLTRFKQVLGTLKNDPKAPGLVSQ